MLCCVAEMLDTTFLELLRCQVTEFLVLRRTQCQVWPLSTCGVCWGGRGGFGVVVTPTHSHRGAVAEEVESSAGTIFRHPAAQPDTTWHHHSSAPANIRRVGGGCCGGYEVPGGALHVDSSAPPLHTAPTQTHGTIHSSRHVVPRCHRRAAPCTAGPAARRRGAQLRIARLEGLKFRGIQMQTRGNFLVEQ